MGRTAKKSGVGESTTNSKSTSKGGVVKSQRTRSIQSYAEDEEPEEDEIEEGQFDASQLDDDPVSTIELAAVLKAFSKGKSKKAADNSKLIEKQIQDLINSTHSNINEFISVESDKCDKAVKNLNLDDESIPGGIDAIACANLVHDLSNEGTSIIDALDSLVEDYNPENNEYFVKVKELLIARNSRAKKAHKKFIKHLRRQQDEQLEMSQMHAEAGPIIYKHFKAIVRV